MKKEAFIVSLSDQGAPRPKYGPFLWNNTYRRYVWRGEVATTIGQLAELVTQAAAFIREQDNYFLVLSVVEVPWSEAEAENTGQDLQDSTGLGGIGEADPLAASNNPENPVNHVKASPVELPRKAPRKLRVKSQQEPSAIPAASPFETP